MNNITEANGLEEDRIYRHFNSKEEIAEAAFLYALEACIKLRGLRSKT